MTTMPTDTGGGGGFSLDNIGNVDSVSLARFAAGLFSSAVAPDFTEQDRILIQKWMELGMEVPQLDTRSITPDEMRVLGKLAAHGYESAAAKLESVGMTLPTEQKADWDASLARVREMAEGGMSGSEKADLAAVTDQMAGVIGGAWEAGKEWGQRTGIRGPAVLTAMDKGKGQQVSEAMREQSRAGASAVFNRSTQASMALPGMERQREEAEFNQNFSLMGYVDKFNQWASGAVDQAGRFGAQQEQQAGMFNIQNMQNVQAGNVSNQYNAQRADQANFNKSRQSEWDMRRAALAGESDARRGYNRSLAAETRADEQRRDALARGGASIFEQMRGDPDGGGGGPGGGGESNNPGGGFHMPILADDSGDGGGAGGGGGGDGYDPMRTLTPPGGPSIRDGGAPNDASPAANRRRRRRSNYQ
jgi:hypothetical protein